MRNEWAERLEAERNGFVDDLVSRGFRLVGAGPEPRLVGELTYPPNADADAVAVEISLPEGWPYQPTKVRPTAWSEPLSWHQEANGALCLFPTSTAGLPWADPDQLLERVARWFSQAAAGWPDDEPDLDLERYFESAVNEEFLVYDGVQSPRQADQGRGAEDMGSAELRACGKSAARRANLGWALDLGELAAPVRTWDGILGLLGEDATKADRLIRRAGAAFILLRYQRGSHEGVVALRATLEEGEVRLATIESADKSASTLRLRAGYDADDLARFTVAIVGAGAVGSVLADQLSRAGIGKLRLTDKQRLRPGNAIRHLLDLASIGKNKAAAVADHIRASNYCPPGGVESVNSSVRVPDDAARAFDHADLVIDATGNPATTLLLIGAAESLRRKLLVAYLQRDGDIARIERYPRLEDESAEPPAPPEPEKREELREGGCGDPVSPAPPSSAWIAAGIASQAAADILIGRPHPPALTYILRPQRDEPYQRHAILQ